MTMTTKKIARLSVVVPVYNGALTVADLVEQLLVELPNVADLYEIVLVNDGSRDESWAKISALAAAHPEVKGIDLMRNFGQHNALLAGIRSAVGDVVITMDDDLQHPPSQIPILLGALTDGVDVVYGVPQKQTHGLLRDLASITTKLVLQHAMGADVASRISAFRAFRTTLRAGFETFAGSFVSLDVLLTWGTTRFAAVEVEHHPRKVGQSAYTVRKLITHAVNMITGFSTLPLQIASLVGFGFTLCGIAILVYVLTRYFVNGAVVPGFAFLASSIAIFSGAQLFAIGIIGEYLARAHFRLMDKPSYVVRDRAS